VRYECQAPLHEHEAPLRDYFLVTVLCSWRSSWPIFKFPSAGFARLNVAVLRGAISKFDRELNLFSLQVGHRGHVREHARPGQDQVGQGVPGAGQGPQKRRPEGGSEPEGVFEVSGKACDRREEIATDRRIHHAAVRWDSGRALRRVVAGDWMKFCAAFCCCFWWLGHAFRFSDNHITALRILNFIPRAKAFSLTVIHWSLYTISTKQLRPWEVCSLNDLWPFAASHSLMHFINQCTWKSSQYYIIIIVMASFMHVS